MNKFIFYIHYTYTNKYMHNAYINKLMLFIHLYNYTISIVNVLVYIYENIYVFKIRHI